MRRFAGTSSAKSSISKPSTRFSPRRAMSFTRGVTSRRTALLPCSRALRLPELFYFRGHRGNFPSQTQRPMRALAQLAPKSCLMPDIPELTQGAGGAAYDPEFIKSGPRGYRAKSGIPSINLRGVNIYSRGHHDLKKLPGETFHATSPDGNPIRSEPPRCLPSRRTAGTAPEDS